MVLAAWLGSFALGCGESGRGPGGSADCLGCHSAGSLTQVLAKGSAREAMGDLGRGFEYSVGARVVFPRRGAHAKRDLESCLGCHIGHSGFDDVASNRNLYPSSALSRLHEGGTDCATGCHDWLGVPIFKTGFQNFFGRLPYWEGDLDPYRILETSSHAFGDQLLTGNTTPGHRQILREGWSRPARRLLAFATKADRYEPGCGGCHDLSGEARHGEMPACNDCHVYTERVPPGANGRFTVHALHVLSTSSFLPFADPPDALKGACVFCHVSDETGGLRNDPLTRRICYNCHLSAHHTINSPAIVPYWETFPIGTNAEEVRRLEAEFRAEHPDG